MCLDFCRRQRPLLLCDALASVQTPLRVEAWRAALRDHPDRALAHYLVSGLQQGFRIGFNYSSKLRSATVNMGSASQHPKVISSYLEKELQLGRMLGPFPSHVSGPPLHFNRIGVVPKGYNTGKWRLITDLSYPSSGSVNDGIDPSLCSLTYSSVDQVADMVVTLGQGALMAKIDIESAYRLIPVHPQDRPLQAMRWNGKIFVDPMLPFGLRSAPKIFNAVADALHWCLQREGIQHILHYLDDFILVTPPDSPEGDQAVATLNRLCATLGVPLAEHKRDGPTTCLVFLGIEIDTVAMVLRLPNDKLQRLKEHLQNWGDREFCARKELQSLIGLLNHACKVVRSGRAFLRRMIDTLHGRVRDPHSGNTVRLSMGFRSDLAWWCMFVSRWNGVSFLPTPIHLPAVEMASDASGSWGCGAWHQNMWFQLPWDSRSLPLPISVKELIPIILGCAAWGHLWQARKVICNCDNQVVVAALRSRSSRDSSLMHLIRSLVFVEAHFRCHLCPVYVNTHDNYLADDLSRDNLASFLLKVPQASRQPTSVSKPLLNLMLDSQLDWTSPTWRHQFSAIFNKV